MAEHCLCGAIRHLNFACGCRCLFQPQFKMNSSGHKRLVWAFIVAAPVIFVALAALQARIDEHTRSFARSKEELVLRSGSALKKASLGYDALMADIYWTRAVQYFGARSTKRDEQMGLLDPLLDITTTLDPRLVVAYRFGAIFLSEPAPIGAGRTDLAVDLVKRGIAANPDQWLLYHDLGFLYYWRLKDYPQAAATYLAGSKVKGAPTIMKLMAARIAENGGSIETSRLIFWELYESTKDPNVRKAALKQLRSLKAQEDEKHLDELIDQYRKRLGRNPASTRDLVTAGLLPGVPVDSLGFPYVIGSDGKSHLDPNSSIEEPKP